MVANRTYSKFKVQGERFAYPELRRILRRILHFVQDKLLNQIEILKRWTAA